MTMRQPQDLNRKLERGYSVSPSVRQVRWADSYPLPSLTPSDGQARHCKSPCLLLYA